MNLSAIEISLSRDKGRSICTAEERSGLFMVLVVYNLS